MAIPVLDTIYNFFVKNQHQINDYDTHVAVIDKLLEINYQAYSIKPVAAILGVKLRQCLKKLRKAFRPQLKDEAVRQDVVLTTATVCKQLILLCSRQPDHLVRTYLHAHTYESCEISLIINGIKMQQYQQVKLSSMILHAHH